MVATKLSELAGKGWGWYAFPLPNENKEIEKTVPTSPLTRAPVSSSSLQQVAQSAYSGITNAYSSLYVPSLTLSGRNNSKSNAAATANLNPTNSEEQDGFSASSTSITSGLSKSSINSKRKRSKSLLSPNLLTLMHNPYIGVRGGGRLHRAKPPHESMDAVRKLLYVVDDNGGAGKDKKTHERGFGDFPQRRLSSHSVHFDHQENHNNEHPNVTIPLPPLTPISRRPFPATYAASTSDSSTATPVHRNNAIDSSIGLNNNKKNNHTRQREEVPMRSFLPQQLATIESMQSSPSVEHNRQTVGVEQDPNRAQNSNGNTIYNTINSGDEKSSSSSHSPEETASQLTEGTLRAMRDLALDEALELHNSLKYWSDRWERPVFSWFVAGPFVWFGWILNNNNNNNNTAKHCRQARPGRGYDHAVMVGRKVSQIQAVLARRLSAIGELQHHLLRSGWQRGVAHWGFLGEGGNWAAVDGTDGRMADDDDDDDSSRHSFDDSDYDDEEGFHDEEYDKQQHNQNEDDSVQFFAEPQDHNATNMLNNNNNVIKPLDLLQPSHPHQHQHQHQHQYQHPNRSHRYRLLRREFSEASVGSIGLHIDVPPSLPSPSFSSPTKATSGRMSQHDERRKQGNSLYYTNLHVRKRNGGHIQKDDPALAEWSIDALALIRSQLIRAANGKTILPYSENWPFEHATGNASVVEESMISEAQGNQNGMPAWAGMKYVSSSCNYSNRARTRMESRGSCYSITEHTDHHALNGGSINIQGNATSASDVYFPKIGAGSFESQFLVGEEETQTTGFETNHSKGQQQFPQKRRSPSQRSISSTKERAVMGISNLPLMTNEVSSLLDVMEDIMDIQRARRLEKLKPPPWWRQNWFLVVLGPPSIMYLLYINLIGKGQTWNLVRYAAEKMMDFAREHVVLPCVALYDEFTKGPESISDHAARDTATETLKKMIRSWLDETYPEMQVAEKVRLSDAMDITLVEETKEKSMTSVYNMNSVIRMSFIEAQFIKKEMMNALVALDEMQASTNFNMNLAAITPFVLLIWTIKKVSGFIVYTAFKWGKSRKETYSSFFDALTEIERLLIMRSNPPAPPTIPRYDPSHPSHHHRVDGSHTSHATPGFGDCVLESDDLGMLMLHIHELRTILWQERRRFSPNALRSVSEDLAELSGERGAVSVRQQLLIVERMNRAYSFLKQGAIV